MVADGACFENGSGVHQKVVRSGQNGMDWKDEARIGCDRAPLDPQDRSARLRAAVLKRLAQPAPGQTDEPGVDEQPFFEGTDARNTGSLPDIVLHC